MLNIKTIFKSLRDVLRASRIENEGNYAPPPPPPPTQNH